MHADKLKYKELAYFVTKIASGTWAYRPAPLDLNPFNPR